MKIPANDENGRSPSFREAVPAALPAPRDGVEPPEIRGPRVFLIRHADASEGKRDGDGGRHLTPLGQRQAVALARRLAHWRVDAILCSDKHRARETAAAIHRYHPSVPLVEDQTFREASRRLVQAHASGDPAHGDLLERLQAAWERLITLASDVTVLVAHNGLIKYFLGRIVRAEGVLKPRFHCTETGITGIRLRPQGPLLEFFNDTHHLTPDLVTPGSKVPWIEGAVGGKSRGA